VRSSSPGQASVDYVAVIALVCVLLAGAGATVGAPWLGDRMAGTIRHGICIVSGAYCTVDEAKRAGLAPCPVHRRSDAERAGVTAVLHLGRDDVLLVERRSDGTVSIAFVNGWQGGAEIGVSLPIAGRSASATARALAIFNSGRSWELPSWPAAQRFLRRFAREETLTGEARRRLRRLCPFCHPGPQLPPPDARYAEGGLDVELQAALGIPRASGSAFADGLLVAGRRRAGRRVTTYLRFGADVTVHLGTVLASLGAAERTQGVLELTREDGRLVEARVRAAAEVAGEVEIAGSSATLAGVADRVRSAVRAARGGGVAMEAQVSLDLTDPANLRAVAGLLQPGSTPLGWAERARALGRRLDVAGEVDLDLVRTTRETSGHELGIGAGLRMAAGYTRTRAARELLAAWSLRAGGPLRRREDCEAAAA
jgi:hypothetical protein